MAEAPDLASDDDQEGDNLGDGPGDEAAFSDDESIAGDGGDTDEDDRAGIVAPPQVGSPLTL